MEEAAPHRPLRNGLHAAALVNASPMSETEIPFYAAVALAGLAFVMVDVADRAAPVLRRILPIPLTAGLVAALVILGVRLAGKPVAVPHNGTDVDFLMALLTTNMGLHLTPKVLRKGLPLFGVMVLCGLGLYWIQLLVVLPVASAGNHVLATAVLTGPLSFLGAPYNLNPPQQVPPVADLLRPAFSDPEDSAKGMMMLGVLLGPVLTSWSSSHFFRRAGGEPPLPPAQDEQTPSVAISIFGQRETHVIVVILGLIALAFLIQKLAMAAVPGMSEAHLPVIVISYLLGGLVRLSAESLKPGSFPESALTALLLGPTMSIVLTYAIMSVPLHQLAHLTPLMVVAGLLSILSSVAFGWVMFPVFEHLAGRYYGAVIATALIAVTTGWGPVAMSFLRRSTDERGEIEPMPAILPLNAFYIFPWIVILSTKLVFAAF